MLKEDKYFDLDNLVDETFKSSPGFLLPDNFAETLAEKVGRKFEWELYVKEFLIYFGVFVGIGLASAGITFMAFDYNLKEWFEFIINNVSLIIGLYVITTFILFADRVLLRYFMYKSKMEVV